MLVLKSGYSTAEHEELNSVECRVAQMHTCLLLLFRQTNNKSLRVESKVGECLRMCGGKRWKMHGRGRRIFGVEL